MSGFLLRLTHCNPLFTDFTEFSALGVESIFFRYCEKCETIRGNLQQFRHCEAREQSERNEAIHKKTKPYHSEP